MGYILPKKTTKQDPGARTGLEGQSGKMEVEKKHQFNTQHNVQREHALLEAEWMHSFVQSFVLVKYFQVVLPSVGSGGRRLSVRGRPTLWKRVSENGILRISDWHIGSICWLQIAVEAAQRQHDVCICVQEVRWRFIHTGAPEVLNWFAPISWTMKFFVSAIYWLSFINCSD